MQKHLGFHLVFLAVIICQKIHTQFNSPEFELIGKLLQFPDFRGIHIYWLFNRLGFSTEFLLEVSSGWIISKDSLVHGCEAMAQSTGTGTQGMFREFIKARSQATCMKPKRKPNTIILQ